MNKEQNPDDILDEARLWASQAEGAWSRYNDHRAGQMALKALRQYMDLDALLTARKVELPRQWQ